MSESIMMFCVFLFISYSDNSNMSMMGARVVKSSNRKNICYASWSIDLNRTRQDGQRALAIKKPPLNLQDRSAVELCSPFPAWKYRAFYRGNSSCRAAALIQYITWC